MIFITVRTLHQLILPLNRSSHLLQLTFTGVIVSTMQVATNGSNYLPPGAAELLTEPEIVSAIWGSKMTLILEEFTLTTTWLIKACMLLMYSRLT
jgi:hypothetical protein